MEIFLFLVIVALCFGLFTLRSRLQDLHEELRELKLNSVSDKQLNEFTRRLWLLENPARAIEPEPQPAEPEPPAPAPQVTPKPVDLPEPVFAEPIPTIERPSIERPSLAERLRGMLGNQEWEMLVGGSLLNKVGALVLVIGIALFLGYSFGHITPAGRASMAVVFSFALSGAGVRTERSGQYRTFARGLIGAGWAALYATSYAIYAIPEARIIENPFAGSIVVLLVAIGMIWNSLRYRSQAITAVAYFAAFAAMAVTPSSPFAVISLIPLAASLLYLARRFDWHSMPLFGLAATYLTCISRGNSGAPLATTQSLFLTYWLLFEVFDLFRVKRRLLAGGLDLLFPLNTSCFLALSYLAWSSHAPNQLWLASAFGATLFLANALARAAVRSPASFDSDADLVTRLRAGSYEGAFLVSAILAGLAIVGRVPGVWAGAGLAFEAEVVYLAGLRLNSSFLRRFGSSAFAISVLQTLGRVDAQSKSVLFGHWTRNWTSPMLLHAALFYMNRAIQRPNLIMSSCAALILAAVIAAEVPISFVGTAWVLLALALWEVGVQKRLIEFRAQGWAFFACGLLATAVPGGTAIQHDWLPPAISLAAFYAIALQTRWRKAFDPFSLSMCGGTAILASLLAWRLAPAEYLALIWCLVTIAVLELGSNRLPPDLRIYFAPLALLTGCGVIETTWDTFTKYPPTPVWLTYTFACLAAAAATARLTLRPSPETMQWERTTLRDTIAALTCAAGFAALWLVVPEPFVTVLWTALAVAVCEAGTALEVDSFRLVSLLALLAVYLRVFAFDLDNAALTAVPIAIAGGYRIWYRTSNREPDRLARLQFWAALVPLIAFIHREAGPNNYPAGWSLLAVVLVAVAGRFTLPDAGFQSYVVAAMAFVGSMFLDIDPPRLRISGLTVAGFYTAQYLARRRANGRASMYFSLLGTLLLTAVLYFQASGGLLTISWGFEGGALLAFGFLFRERILRLQGLGLLLTCILKLFLYDLRNLEAIYRILSFVALGLILLSVSWIYTRFREQIKRLL